MNIRILLISQVFSNPKQLIDDGVTSVEVKISCECKSCVSEWDGTVT